jgi:hypothetical protein
MEKVQRLGQTEPSIQATTSMGKKKVKGYFNGVMVLNTKDPSQITILKVPLLFIIMNLKGFGEYIWSD